MLGVEERREHERDLALEDLDVVAACFEEQDRGFGVLGELAGQDGASGSGTHNHFCFQPRSLAVWDIPISGGWAHHNRIHLAIAALWCR